MNKRFHPEIVFIYLPYLLDNCFDYNLGTAYIRAYLKERGISSAQFTYYNSINLPSLVNKLLEYNSNIIGFSCLDYNYNTIKTVIKTIKSRNSKINILVGGPTATFSDELIMRDCPEIDICVRGEGEQTVYEIIKFFQGNLGIEKIKGITYRRGKEIIRAIDRPLMGVVDDGGLDIFPSPYLRGLLYTADKTGIITSRGCDHKCIYCNFSSMSRYTVRYHSINRVISELKMINKSNLSRNNNRAVVIYDDYFTINLNRAKQICKEIIKNKFKLTFRCELRADKVDKELLELLYLAGFRIVNFGLESAIPKVLRIIKKVNYLKEDLNLNAEKNFLRNVKENVKLAKDIGLSPSVSVIFGLPGETIEEGRRTKRFVKDLNVRSYAHNDLAIFPGTELFKTYRDYDLKVKKSKSLLPFFTIHRYDVNKIKFEKNVPNLKYYFYYLRQRYITDVVFGYIRDLWTYEKSGPFIILNDIYKINKELKNWLKNNIPVNGILTLTYTNIIDKNFVLQKGKEIIGLVGLSDIIWLYKVSRANSMSITYKSFPMSSPAMPLSLYKIISFSQISNLIISDKKIPEHRYKIILSFSKEDDLLKILELIKKDAYGKKLNRVINLDPFFEDGCRWLGRRACPALNLEKMIVEKDGLIKCCTHSPYIGNVSDERIKIIRILRRRFKIEMEKRKCQSCTLYDRCSKCLFPFPLNAERYCSIRKTFSQFANIITSINTLRHIKDRKWIKDL